MLHKSICLYAQFVSVLGESKSSGQFCPYGEPPADQCSVARVVPGDSGQHVVLVDAHEATAGDDPYSGISVGHTTWFSVTPTVSGPMTISTCHPHTTFDIVIDVYAGGESSCEFRQMMTCNDDVADPRCDNGCSYWGSGVVVNAVAGQRYRFVVGSVNQTLAACALCVGVVVTIEPTCGEGREGGELTAEFTEDTEGNVQKPKRRNVERRNGEGTKGRSAEGTNAREGIPAERVCEKGFSHQRPPDSSASMRWHGSAASTG